MLKEEIKTNLVHIKPCMRKSESLPFFFFIFLQGSQSGPNPQKYECTRLGLILTRLCNQSHWTTGVNAVAPLAWVPWVPENPSIFEKLVLEPINFGKKQLKFAHFLVENEQNIGVGNFE